MIKMMAPAVAAALGAASLLAGACAPAAAPGAGAPVADPDSLEAAILAAAVPSSPRQVTFGWRLDEAGSTVRGRGVVRYRAPDRIRLDLFGPRGETYLIAALVEDEFRLPPGAAGGFELPSPALLWAALGVVQPPAGAVLQSAATGSGTATLTYATGGDERHSITVLLGGPRPLVSRVERIGPSGVLESVRIEYSDDNRPARTVYVDRRTYRELVLERESARDVESFPESIWRPDAPGG